MLKVFLPSLFSALFLFTTPILADPPDCAKNNEIEIGACLQEAAKKADRIMNETYNKKMSQLGNESKDRLRKAQRAWIVFRDMSCHYEADVAKGGSMEGELWQLCLEKMTKQRSKELEEYISCTENGCP